jgi:site-specific DNA recombinase
MSSIAALYQRVSDGTDKSVLEQNRANSDAARDHGWEAVPFSDAVSASRFGRKPRPGWEALIAGVAARRFGYVVLWESSRGDRTLTSWAAFLDACRDTGTRVYVTSQDRLFDLSNGYDWRTLASEGVDAAFESEKISKRTRRGTAGALEAGTPYGRIPYGYRRTYTRETGRARPLPHQEADPVESLVVREILGRLARADSITGILRDFDRRGIQTRAGKSWSGASIARIATDGFVYIGKRRSADGVLSDGNWPALVTEDVFWAAHAVVTDPARKVQAEKRGGIRPGAARWLLSYLAVCGVCGRPLSVKNIVRVSGDIPHYRCSQGCVTAPVKWIDELAIVGAALFCSQSPLFEMLTRSDGAEARTARAEAAAERARLAEFEEQAASGAISAASFARIASGIESRIAELEERATRLSTPPPLRDLMTGVSAATPEERFAEILTRLKDMPLTSLRAVVRAAFAPVLYPAGADPRDPARFKMPPATSLLP